MDPLVFFQREYDKIAPALPFVAKTIEEAVAWQKKARPQLRRLLGDFPRVTGPVGSRVLEERGFSDYHRTKLSLELYPGLTAIAYYLLPKNRPKKGPAILAVPGHGKSVEDLIGGPDGKGDPLDYALQCAKAGIPTLALEQIAFGERRHAQAIRENPEGGTACIVPAGAALMLGRTLMGYRIVETRRALDWLSARPEVDPKRLAMTGISGGGQVTFHTAALDPRIKAILVSGYFNTYRGSVYSIYHCTDNFIPGIIRWFEMPDLVGLIAPRAAFFEQGDKDPIFPVETFRFAVEKAQRIYKVFGVPERTGSAIFPGEHEWNGKEGIPWLVRMLRE
ncbi:MAG TPA: alpha/beta hydrolase family protein [Armatimonadota bacterium]|nr:alpha/beta hydrolase family protein [Armatimonadota bacterium]